MLCVESIINSVFNSKTYIISETNGTDLYIVDCGDADKIVAYTKERGLTLKEIFLTHTHFDHIYGLNIVLAAFPKCEVYTSEYGAMALLDDRKNFSFYHESPIGYNGPKPKVLRDGDNVQLFRDCMLQVTETPGHCPSCLTYIIGNYLFTGDSYIPGIKVVTNLPKGDKSQAQESIDKILELSENRIICPGHDFNKYSN